MAIIFNNLLKQLNYKLCFNHIIFIIIINVNG